MINLANINKEINPEYIRTIALSNNMYESEREFKLSTYSGTSVNHYVFHYNKNYTIKNIPQYYEYNFNDVDTEYLINRYGLKPIEILGFYERRLSCKIYYISGEFSAFYYSKASDRFFSIKQKIIFPYAIPYGFDLDEESLAKSCVNTTQTLAYKYNTDVYRFIRECLKYHCSDPVYDRFIKLLHSSSTRSVLEGKSLKEFNCCFNSPSKMPFKYGIEEYFLDIDVEFESDYNSSKYFDWITVGGYVYDYNKYEFVKANKNKILKMYLDAIRSTAKWKSFNIPINVLKVDSLMLDKGGYLIAKFSLKETSQS